MNVTIVNKEKDLLYEETNASFAGETESIDAHYWKTVSRTTQLPGIRITAHELQVREEIHLRAVNPEAAPALFFVQQGRGTTTLPYHDQPVQFRSGHHDVLYNAFSSEDTLLSPKEELVLFILSFTPEYFLQLAATVGGGLDSVADSIATRSPQWYQPHCALAIEPKMYAVISDIMTCAYEGGLKQLYLQSKALELLTLHCAQVTRGKTEAGIKLSAEDRSKIYQAREILISNFTDPPGLRELTRLCGLNEFKLKAGFKKEFSQSVFSYLNDFRLQHCRQEIQGSKKPLSAIAYEAGFCSLAHFSNAFKKKYGVSPGQMR